MTLSKRSEKVKYIKPRDEIQTQVHFNGSSQVKPKTETEKRQTEATVKNKGR